MAYSAGNLKASLSLNITAFTQNLNAALAQAKGAGTQFKNSFNSGGAEVKNTNDALRDTQANLKDVRRIVSGILISQVFYSAVRGIEKAGAAVLQFQNDMQQASISLDYLLGSKDRAQSFLQVMQDFATVTPYNTQESVAWAKQLMAMGITGSQVKGVMETLADASAATGGTAEQMDRIVLAIGEIESTGKLSARQVRQLAQAGIPAYKMLQDQLHLTSKQMENIGKQNISSATAINALMRGLQQKYKGASAEVADTWAGMWSTIQDDATIVSAQITNGLFGKLNSGVRAVRDFMERIRAGLKTGGLGGAFEAIVPPELQDQIRVVIGAFQRLNATIGTLVSTVGAIFGDSFKLIIGVMAQVLPPIVTLVSKIIQLISVAVKANPILRGLAIAIATLMIAQAAAGVLSFLWRIVGMGSICATIGAAVGKLTTAVIALGTAMIANPIILIGTAIIAVLLYWAYASGVLTRALGQLQQAVGSLLGIDVNSILQPEGTTTSQKWYDQYNAGLAKLQDSLDDTGDSANSTGKKVSKFVASFDEVFQVPDKLDEAAGALGDLLGDLNLPDLPDGTSAAKKDDSSKNTTNGAGIVPPFTIPPTGPNWPKPNFEPALTAIYAFQLKLQQALNKAWLTAKGWVADVNSVFAGFPVPSIEGVQEWTASWQATFDDAYRTVEDWVARVNQLLAPIILPALDGTAFENSKAQYLQPIPAPIIAAVVAPAIALADFLTSKVSYLLPIVAPTIAAATAPLLLLKDFLKSKQQYQTTVTAPEVEQATVPALDTESAFLPSVRAAQLAVEVFAISVATSLSNLGGKMDQWSATQTTNISNWSHNTSQAVSTWATTTGTTIQTWLSTQGNNFTQWYNQTATGMNNWSATNTSNLKNWSHNTSTAIMSWASTTYKNFYLWASGVTDNINKALSATAQSFGSWFKGVADGIAKWANKALNAICNAFNQVAEWIGKHKVETTAIVVGTIVVGSLALAPFTGGASLAGLAAAENGGIVTRDQLIRVGEKNKREAIVPLQNDSAMQPFATAVAAGVLQQLQQVSQPVASSNASSNLPPLLVGTLIADEFSLKTLARKIQIINLQEKQRVGDEE